MKEKEKAIKTTSTVSVNVDTDVTNYPERIGSSEPGAIEMWDKVRKIVPEMMTT